ncbi:uncharacterized protein LOC144647484 [Oculina patagonica]
MVLVTALCSFLAAQELVCYLYLNNSETPRNNVERSEILSDENNYSTQNVENSCDTSFPVPTSCATRPKTRANSYGPSMKNADRPPASASADIRPLMDNGNRPLESTSADIRPLMTGTDLQFSIHNADLPVPFSLHVPGPLPLSWQISRVSSSR